MKRKRKPTFRELSAFLDRQVANGNFTARIGGTGRIEYHATHKATSDTLRNSLSVSEIRNLRCAGVE